MSTTEIRSATNADMKLEVLVIPVDDAVRPPTDGLYDRKKKIAGTSGLVDLGIAHTS